MRFKFFLSLLFAALIVGVVSCSEDKASDPAGTATLNMYNEKNGKTQLGNSDVYINTSNNFRGSRCLLVDLGRKGGLGSIGFPELKLLSSEVAAEPGHGYLIMKDEAVREFKSGVLALVISADYYKVYVKSTIERDGEPVGAVVQYALAEPATHGLPEYDSELAWELWTGDYFDVMLSTSDFEYELEGDGVLFQTEKLGRKLRISCIDWNVNPDVDYELYLRIRDSYTRVKLRVHF